METTPAISTSDARQPERRRTLFLSYLYPSCRGTGTQIRAAALLRMLAAHDDIYLLVAHLHTNPPAPRDTELEGLCKKVHLIPFLPETEKEGGPPHIRKQAELPTLVRQFYKEHQLNSLFVFRFESCFLIKGTLAAFPHRSLDLDEFPSRRINMLDHLKTTYGLPVAEQTDRRFQMAIRLMEKDLIPQFERTFVSSELEAVDARRLAAENRIHVLPNIFPHHTPQPIEAISQPQEIFFVGSFFHSPNVDAVLYFCREVFPLIRQKLGRPVIFRIVGVSCPSSVLALAEQPGVQVMGYQENLEPFYARSSLVVVPLRAGAGTRVKILEALVYGRPVVSTTIGAAGLKVTNGENILLADTAEDFAQACVKILESPELAARLVEGGHQLHRESYSPEALLRTYDEIMART